ncbi:hypothetical protein [Pedobacter sp. SYP-B3415]|nr:hypothetical protein [Pedobacter sp. SYP-B3415]
MAKNKNTTPKEEEKTHNESTNKARGAKTDKDSKTAKSATEVKVTKKK